MAGSDKVSLAKLYCSQKAKKGKKKILKVIFEKEWSHTKKYKNKN